MNGRIAIFFVVSIFFHVAMLVCAGLFDIASWLRIQKPSGPPTPATIELVSLPSDATAEDEAAKDEEPLPEPVPPDPSGQLVEIAPPEEDKIPEKSDYLAEYNQTVPEEMRSERFEVNPEILARKYSEERRIEIKGERVPDLNVTDPGTGATAGNDRFDPDRDGSLAALPGTWEATNGLGDDKPIPSAVLRSIVAGAPQNDRLDERVGPETRLNTKEFVYAGYLLRIRRLVNFYWSQNLDNLPSSVRLAKPLYTTAVEVTLDGNGSLESIQVSTASGSSELDDAVVRAFKVAGPFPNPPPGIIDPDGRVRLPNMRFTVELGMAEMKYDGIDPRAGTQFPGLLKSPR